MKSKDPTHMNRKALSSHVHVDLRKYLVPKFLGESIVPLPQFILLFLNPLNVVMGDNARKLCSPVLEEYNGCVRLLEETKCVTEEAAPVRSIRWMHNAVRMLGPNGILDYGNGAAHNCLPYAVLLRIFT